MLRWVMQVVCRGCSAWVASSQGVSSDPALIENVHRILQERPATGGVQIAAPEANICEHSIVELSEMGQLPAMLDGNNDPLDSLHRR